MSSDTYRQTPSPKQQPPQTELPPTPTADWAASHWERVKLVIESNKKNHDKGQDSARDDFKQKPESRRIIPPKPTAKQRLENFLASAAAVGLAKIRAPFRFIRDTLHWLFPSKQVKRTRNGRMRAIERASNKWL